MSEKPTDLDTRAHHAKRLMEDPYLIEAFDLVRQAIHESFEQISPLDETKLELNAFSLLALRLQLLDSVWENIEHVIREQKITAFNDGLINGGQSGTH